MKKFLSMTMTLIMLMALVVPAFAVDKESDSNSEAEVQEEILESASEFAYGNGYTIDEPYEYPIKPGTEEWFAIESHSEKVKMLQIPQETLEKMTTQALAESVANYPYLGDMLAFSTSEKGYETVRDGFNGLQELENRPDGISALSEYYESQQMMRSTDMSYVVRSAIEITIEENRIENNEQALNERVAAAQLPKTPSGTTVTSSWCHYDSPELTASERADINDYVKSNYGLSPLREPTRKYNCHSYAWYSQSSSNLWWIDYPDDFMNDSYYTENTGVITGNNIAVYRSHPSSTEYLHSAIVTGVGTGSGPNPPITVVSKWGRMGLYSHMLYNCPADYGRTMLFYKVA